MASPRHASRRLLGSLGSCRAYSSQAAPGARLISPSTISRLPFSITASSTLSNNPELPQNAFTKRLNLYQSINSAPQDRSRCRREGASTEFGSERVFNTPLTEQGIVGFGIGAAAEGFKPVAEIQFADYVFPAFDQLVNEAAKFRFREGATGGNIGGLVVRMPCGAVGHGALYHSQSPESLFTHVPGLRVVIPRSPTQAKGLLLNAILNCKDPVVFMEPKILYRAAVEYVPTEPYYLPLDKADIVKPGKDRIVISLWSTDVSLLRRHRKAEKDFGCEHRADDLGPSIPWDRETVLESVRKTGRAIVVHESMMNARCWRRGRRYDSGGRVFEAGGSCEASHWLGHPLWFDF
ncbi:2-oxoisovalerate dehydrogenase subunit beta [Coccidioides immitis RMSCC 3703]|uniref:3-methyl-2-oxobutanoate dehydrogenase (2-methylpropanoyl-transferring) n=1 Tax=Coccidioides immitis RMSCC 3703 TaxID=454286 RepID=A0A0J8QP83_COCIT|nr:2-oxoisovalerate dehydrogenase subunit beta [Coccidioides immitis RMSCC 3703]